jgi:DNA-binding NarL/FixJ family response regulator
MPRKSPPTRPKLHPEELLASTAVAAFSSDQSGRITVWNQSAEALLGHPAASVLGERCYEVIGGRDLFGNRYCNDSCAVRKMLRHHEPIHPYVFEVKHLSGKTVKVKCSIIVARGARPRGFDFIHLMESVDRAPDLSADGIAQRDAARIAPRFVTGKRKSVSPSPALTRRETEVLRLMASGIRTKDIAQTLGIQRTTVGNHIQHILGKLGAHTKLQAVYVAQRRGLL